MRIGVRPLRRLVVVALLEDVPPAPDVAAMVLGGGGKRHEGEKSGDGESTHETGSPMFGPSLQDRGHVRHGAGPGRLERSGPKLARLLVER